MFGSALTGLERTPTVFVCRFGMGIVVQVNCGRSYAAPASSLQVLGVPPPNRTGQGLNHNESGLLAGNYEEETMSLGTILLIVLILMLIGVIPTWPHSRSWGYWPSGAIGVVVLIIIILLVMGRL